MRLLLALLLVLAACGRPLTAPETDLAQRLFGTTLDPTAVRFYRNGFVGMRRHAFAARPRTTCRERILPPRPAGELVTSKPAALALFNRIFFTFVTHCSVIFMSV